MFRIKINKLEKEANDVNDELKKKKKLLNTVKDKRKEWRKKSQRLKQITGIVNDDFLQDDYNKRKNQIDQLKDEIKQLKNQHEQLTANIEKANRYQLQIQQH